MPQSLAGPAGPVADGVDTIKIGDNNVEYAYWPGRTRVKAGTAVTFTNVGDVAHTATAFEKGSWERVTRLYRRSDLPDEQCWLNAPDWALAYA